MGYRMAWGFLREEFAPLNLKRVHRIWKEERLGRMKRYHKKRTGNPVPLAAEAPNHVWCVDFCFDWTENRTKLKVLSVKDEFTKELLALEAAPQFRSKQVQGVLERLINLRGAPAFLRSDNGPEFLSRTLAVFLSKSGSQSFLHRSGLPLAERACGESRTARRGAVSQSGRCPGEAGGLPPLLQRAAAPFVARLPASGGGRRAICRLRSGYAHPAPANCRVIIGRKSNVLSGLLRGGGPV